jgi:hypothetical protein
MNVTFALFLWSTVGGSFGAQHSVSYFDSLSRCENGLIVLREKMKPISIVGVCVQTTGNDPKTKGDM